MLFKLPFLSIGIFAGDYLVSLSESKSSQSFFIFEIEFVELEYIFTYFFVDF